MFSRAAVALLWILHFLPLSVLAALGNGLGSLLYRFAKKRRHIVRTNLLLCFPDLNEEAREALALQHFRVLGRSMLERNLLWWSSRERLMRLIRVEGDEKLQALKQTGRPIMLLFPHFVGIDIGGAAVTMSHDIVCIYAEQSDPVFNRLFLHGRTRFGNQQLLSRRDSLRATVKAMKSGRPICYQPDMNFRTRDAVFSPFFGVPAWTITGLSRISRLTGAAVMPCVSRILPGGEGYSVEFGDAWENFPTEDAEADTRRMNKWIESVVRTMPEQYYWVHRRFKTCPPGEENPYKRSAAARTEAPS